ncbi:MAG: hypothetical protein ACYCT1_07880 [Steroidobacteraceae bacterium]
MISETFSTGPNAPSDPRPHMAEQLTDAAARGKSRASNEEHSTAGKAEGMRDGIADSFDRAATSAHAKAQSEPAGPRGRRAAQAAANTLAHTAEYIRKSDAASVMADAKRLVKDNPGIAMLGAAIIGFVLARAWSRD